jgi:hypothetical protein
MFNCQIELVLKPLASKSLCMPWDGNSAMKILNADINLSAFDFKVQKGTYNTSKCRSSTLYTKIESVYERQNRLAHIKYNQPVNPLEENNRCLL